MQKTVFITGNSSGLGYGLSEEYLARDWRVYGLSRRGCHGLSGDLHDIQCDLQNQAAIAPALTTLLSNVQQLDMVYLNAGILGGLNRITAVSLEQLKQTMDINLWANKLILDWLLTSNIQIKQIIAISSGAALSANKGWGPYSLSKIALNKLMELYANEFPDTHFLSLAPGLMDTAMQDYICDEASVAIVEFPTVKKFRDARGTETMPTPKTAAKAIIEILPRLKEMPSGTYVDIRKL
jgi:benzil reductase ((S)-benzoin forming)